MIKYVRVKLEHGFTVLAKVPVNSDPLLLVDRIYEYFERMGVTRDRVEILSDTEGRAEELHRIMTELPDQQQLLRDGRYIFRFCLN